MREAFDDVVVCSCREHGPSLDGHDQRRSTMKTIDDVREGDAPSKPTLPGMDPYV